MGRRITHPLLTHPSPPTQAFSAYSQTLLPPTPSSLSQPPPLTHTPQVKKAVPKPSNPQGGMGGGGYGGGGGGYGGAPPPLKLFVGGTGEITDDEFKTHFEVYGEMSDCVLLRNADGSSRGFGFVTYTTDEVCVPPSAADSIHTPLRNARAYSRVAVCGPNGFNTEPCDNPNDSQASPPAFGSPSACNRGFPVEPSNETLSRVHTRTVRWVPNDHSGVHPLATRRARRESPWSG